MASVRTTISLDRDVAQRLKKATAKSGRPFKHVVNEALRAGLHLLERPAAARSFKVKALNLGLRPGINLDNIGELLAQVEGEDHR